MRQTFGGFAYKPSLSFISGIGPNGKHVDSDAFHVGEANCQHMGKWVDDIGMLDHKCSETPLPRILSVQGPIWWGALHGDGATVKKGKTRLILVSTTLGNEKQNLFHKLFSPPNPYKWKLVIKHWTVIDLFIELQQIFLTQRDRNGPKLSAETFHELAWNTSLGTLLLLA